MWAPHLYFPWSGGVAQTIEPDLRWFFDSIDASAGNGRIERKAFEVASYGRQLGLITEVLLDSTRRAGTLSSEGEASRKRLEQIQARIERIKEDDAISSTIEIEEKLAQLRKGHPQEFASLKPRLLQIINEQID
jgi:hypothetical protein